MFLAKLVLASVSLIIAGLLSGCMPEFSLPEKPTPQEMAELQPPISMAQKTIMGLTMSYAIRPATEKSANKPTLFFVHGSPGAWHDWRPYLTTDKLSNFGERIAVDRPGFGDSQAAGVVRDLRQQAAMLAELIPEQQQVVVVGHSLGGPLVGWMALDHPEKICAAVSISGSLSEKLEYPRWYNYLADTWLAKLLLDQIFINSNHEMFALQPELAKQEPQWHNLQRPLWLIQGEQDELVNPETVAEITPKIPQKMLHTIKIPEAGHFIIWNDPEKIINLLNQVECQI